MKVLLDIKDNRAGALLDVLKSLPYVKTTSLTPYKAAVIENIKTAVEEMKLVKAGKLKARNATDLFNEL